MTATASPEHPLHALAVDADDAAGRALVLPRDALVDRVLEGRYPGWRQREAAASEEILRVAQARLAHHGMRTDPPLPRASADQLVALRRSPGLAVQGGVLVGFPIVLVGLLAFWVYGVLVALGVTAAAIALAKRFELFDAFAPSYVPRGRLLGAVTTLAAIALIAAVAVLPIWVARKSAVDSDRAAALVVEADAAIDAGDFNTAKAKLGHAETIDPHAKAIGYVRSHLVVAQVAGVLAENERRAGIYDAAERAYDRGETRRAIRLMSRIRGFRNADARLAAYRRAERRTSDR